MLRIVAHIQRHLNLQKGILGGVARSCAYLLFPIKDSLRLSGHNSRALYRPALGFTRISDIHNSGLLR